MKTGDAAPDGDGEFRAFSFSYINEAGQVGFVGALSNTDFSRDSGIFRGQGGAITAIAREGQVIPNGNGLFGNFSGRNLPALGRVINDLGAITFRPDITNDSGTPVSGIYRGDGSNTSEVVRSGQAAPGGGVIIFPGANQTYGSNNLNQTVFKSFDGSAYRTTGGVVETIVKPGQIAPDGDGTFGEVSQVYINDAGQVAFVADLAGTLSGASEGIFRESAGIITQVAANGQATPDGNATFRVFRGPFLFNNSGEVVFEGLLETSGDEIENGFFVGTGTGVARIVREGQATPDGSDVFGTPGPSYGLVGPYDSNDLGQIVFLGFLLDATDASRLGVYRGDTSVITKIVGAGDSAPDGNGAFVSGSFSVINNAGLVGIQGFFGGTLGGATDAHAIILGDGIDLVQVARDGDSLAGSTVTDVILANGRDALNSSGQITYRAVLENGSSLIQRWTPELSWRATESGDWSDPSQWTLGITPGAVHNVSLDSDSDVAVSIPTNVHVNSLSVGGGSGITTISLQAGGSLTTTGNLDVLGNGVLSGTGNVSGEVNNSGIIEANGLSFDTSIMNSESGIITAGSDANVTVAGDLIQNGSLNISENGTTKSTVVVNGIFSGRGGFFGGGRLFSRGRFQVGNSPASVMMDGDLILADSTLSEFEFAGEDIGDFDQLLVTGDLNLDGELTIVELDGFQFDLGQEFIIADVGNLLTGQFTGLNEGDLVGNFSGTDLFISYAAGDGNDVSLFTAAAVPLLGDVNVDGAVDFLDISPFISVLSGGQFQAEADCDESGFVDFFDISPFISILSGP